MAHLAENPMKTGLWVPEIQAVEGFTKQKKTKEMFFFQLVVSQNQIVSSDSFCLIAYT